MVIELEVAVVKVVLVTLGSVDAALAGAKELLAIDKDGVGKATCEALAETKLLPEEDAPKAEFDIGKVGEGVGSRKLLENSKT